MIPPKPFLSKKNPSCKRVWACSLILLFFIIIIRFFYFCWAKKRRVEGDPKTQMKGGPPKSEGDMIIIWGTRIHMIIIWGRAMEREKESVMSSLSCGHWFSFSSISSLFCTCGRVFLPYNKDQKESESHPHPAPQYHISRYPSLSCPSPHLTLRTPHPHLMPIPPH